MLREGHQFILAALSGFLFFSKDIYLKCLLMSYLFEDDFAFRKRL